MARNIFNFKRLLKKYLQKFAYVDNNGIIRFNRREEGHIEKIVKPV